ncbi:MAG: GNAT family N-acetyltransferase [Armatimonadota bacterium]|nr:GNAT family N-acetyltransferase [Armatimonadota bacterium]MDW8291027.1 GNAT family N-acetyltransferase [Armatimonadota bacterium]
MEGRNIQLGIVGAGGRGSSFKAVVDTLPDVQIQAVCDVDEARAQRVAELTGAKQVFTDYEQMLERAEIDAVIVATPMPLHAPQSIAALKRGIHVLSEVPAAVSLAECRELVQAVRESQAVYMMAENYLYAKPIVLVKELVQRGLFGATYYAEGEYIHELKELNELTPWRRRWQTGINGNTYPTHSLGPILEWMPGDRVVQVCCAGSGHHYRDARGELYENEDSTLTLCKMRSGGLVKLRLDMLSDRPHALNVYQLQGTDGCYESARAPGEVDRVWLRRLCPDMHTWLPLQELEEQFLPQEWKEREEQARRTGHGGADYFVLADFLAAMRGERPPSVDVHYALDMTLPGLMSQVSIAQGGRWVEVPDSRAWEESAPQLQMVYPPRRFASLPEPPIPAGYRLRQLRLGEEEKYLALMRSVGFAENWTVADVQRLLRQALPGGFFVVEHEPTGELVATAIANHAPNEQHPNAGVLDWVATAPEHQGRGLGKAVTAAVVRLLIQRGYQEIYLLTDDWRLPAIATYLSLGWEPYVYDEQMRERWERVLAQLAREG